MAREEEGEERIKVGGRRVVRSRKVISVDLPKYQFCPYDECALAAEWSMHGQRLHRWPRLTRSGRPNDLEQITPL